MGGGFNTPPPPPPRTRISQWESMKFYKRIYGIGCFWYTSLWTFRLQDPPPPPIKANSPPPPPTTDQGKGKGRSVVRPMGTVAYRGKGQGKGKGRGEGRLGQGGRGRSKGGEKLMGTTAYGGKGSKGRAANGDRPVGAASCRRDHHTMASCQPPLCWCHGPPPPEKEKRWASTAALVDLRDPCRPRRRKAWSRPSRMGRGRLTPPTAKRAAGLEGFVPPPPPRPPFRHTPALPHTSRDGGVQ